MVKQQQIEVAPEEIEARVQQIAEQEGIDAARLQKTLGEESGQALVREQLVVDKALDFLASVAKVEETADS